MDWANERYVRVYTRDTESWLCLGWEAQCLLLKMLRKADRAGAVETKRGSKGLAALVVMPADVVERVLPELLEDGCVEQKPSGFLIVNFIEAQEASMSPAARQRDSRERRRDMMRQGIDPGARETVVYFIQSEDGGPVKIGHADDLAKRLSQLQTARADELVVLATVNGTLETEREMHRRFAHLRQKGEWFTPAEDLWSFIKGLPNALVPERDESQSVTGHDLGLVTPIRSEPSQHKEERAQPPAALVQAALFVDSKLPALPKPKAKKQAEASPDLTAFRDWWLEAYEAATGHKHSWSGKAAVQSKRLLVMFGLPEVQRRAEILLAGKGPAFIATRDLGTLVSHFDKLAAPADSGVRGAKQDPLPPPRRELRT
jgi:hypothetical protein